MSKLGKKPIILRMTKSRWTLVIWGCVLSTTCHATELQAVTFAKTPGQIYVPFRAVGEALDLEVTWDSASQKAGLGTTQFDESDYSYLFDGTKMIPVRLLERVGAKIDFAPDNGSVTLTLNGKSVPVQLGEKRVEVSISEQKLRAWQGDIMVMETNISSGRPGHATPRGKFKAGPVKDVMHYSRLYDNAPMPWSVQVHGDVFIHGYHSVPRRPASHGCIRMPLTGKNAARYFFGWVDLGTPVTIAEGFTVDQGRSSAK